jgi:hypothetical protein
LQIVQLHVATISPRGPPHFAPDPLATPGSAAGIVATTDAQRFATLAIIDDGGFIAHL